MKPINGIATFVAIGFAASLLLVGTWVQCEPEANAGMTGREGALNAVLERELVLTSERLQYRKRELCWCCSRVF
jgi:hypothetical protein